jgi:uncharacterized damage-inducible protein DinB
MIFSRMRRAARAHALTLAAVDEACALAGDPTKAARRADGVSSWTVQQHLEHLLLADRAIIGVLRGMLRERAPSPGPGRPTWVGYLVLFRGSILRGKGRAPQLTVPTGLELNEVAAGLHAVRGELEALESALPQLAAARSTRPHPVLGDFTPLQWLRFVHVHHVHHGKIIEDILISVC